MAPWHKVVTVAGIVVGVLWAWRALLPEFKEQYGKEEGGAYLALFLYSFPAFFLMEMVKMRQKRRSERLSERPKVDNVL